MIKLSKMPSVLIVDDAPENLDVLKGVLVDDYIVRPAINGSLALRLAFMDPPPDLILLDIMMPGMDGYEVCRQLKKDPCTKQNKRTIGTQSKFVSIIPLVLSAFQINKTLQFYMLFGVWS
jgi:CheY-like chemotaxis protein